MDNKIFYKKRLEGDEDGLVIITDKYISLHETACFHFCVIEYEYRAIDILKTKEETPLQCARRRKKLKRICKTNSRMAFDTEEEALEHLRFLKRRQLQHLRRNIAFNEKFLSAERFEQKGNLSIVPGSRDLVHEHFVFD